MHGVFEIFRLVRVLFIHYFIQMVNEIKELFSEVLVSLNFNYYLYQNCHQLLLFFSNFDSGEIDYHGLLNYGAPKVS